MKMIYLVRHGKSKAQAGEDPDCLNPELSDLGREQSKRLATRLQGIEVDAILLSPLRRAWQTYELSEVDASRIEFDSRLIEDNTGYERILPVELPDIARPDRHDAWLTPPGERSASLMDDLLRNPGENFLLFGHCGIFTRLFHAFAGHSDTLYFMHTDNAAVNRIDIDDVNDRVVRFWNDRTHVLDLLG